MEDVWSEVLVMTRDVRLGMECGSAFSDEMNVYGRKDSAV